MSQTTTYLKAHLDQRAANCLKEARSQSDLKPRTIWIKEWAIRIGNGNVQLVVTIEYRNGANWTYKDMTVGL